MTGIHFSSQSPSILIGCLRDKKLTKTKSLLWPNLLRKNFRDIFDVKMQFNPISDGKMNGKINSFDMFIFSFLVQKSSSCMKAKGFLTCRLCCFLALFVSKNTTMLAQNCHWHFYHNLFNPFKTYYFYKHFYFLFKKL